MTIEHKAQVYFISINFKKGKKPMKRTLSIILVLVMCLTSLPMVFASAAETNTTATITNLFTLKGYGTPNEKEVDGDLTANAHFISSNAIAVTEGDVINIAPVIQAQSFQAVIYKTDAEGAVTTERVKLTTTGVTTELLGDSAESPAIMKYTVPTGVTHIAPVGNQVYEEAYTVTKNQDLTKDICFATWSSSAMKMFKTVITTPVANIVNLFSDKEGGCGVNMGEAHYNYEGGLGSNTKYRATKNAIPVTRDDVIYFVGQTPTGGYSGHFISTFDAEGKGIANLKHAYVSVYADIGNNFVVYAYRAPAGVASVRISATANNYDAGIILATKNQPFDGATFRMWCGINGVECETLVGAAPGTPGVDVGALTGLYNLFTYVTKGGVGIRNAEGRSDLEAGYGVNAKYWCTEPIAVTKDDVIYLVGTRSIGYHFSLFDKDGKGLGTATNVKPASLTVVEELAKRGNETYCIYSYTVPENVGFVRVSQYAYTYLSNCALVTKNQPFNAEKLNEWCTANGGDLDHLLGKDVVVDENSPLYGKTALFIGDSITYGKGEYDVGAPGLAWAGRLAEKYNMDVVNAGDSGARVSQTGQSGFIIDGLGAWNASKSPDMVVMHGGVNDARYNAEVPLGTIDSTDDKTFCGGLNLIFERAKKLCRGADLFYIANFYIPEGKGKVSNMSEYYELAKQICEKHGVTFIDLAGNEELNNTLANKNANGQPNWSKYMPDRLHPNAAGYDVITPYIAKALEDFYLNPKAPETPDNTEETPGNTEETPDNTENEAPANTTGTPDEPEKGCGGFGAAAVAFALAVSVFGAAVTVIKKK